MRLLSSPVWITQHERRSGVEEGFRSRIPAADEAIDVRFEFHSATVSEDGAALLVLFEGTDGHDYACSIPLGEKLGQQATLRRVD